jgi:hypothetical protein
MAEAEDKQGIFTSDEYISKKKLDACILLPNGKALTHVFDNDEKGFEELLKWLDQKQVGVCRAVMEATGWYGEDLAGVLYRKGHTVVIVNRLWCTNQFLDEIRLFLKKPMRLFWLWACQVVPFD